MKTTAPHHFPHDEWYSDYQAEIDAIERYGIGERSRQHCAEFPAPYRGIVTCSAHARFAAICDTRADKN